MGTSSMFLIIPSNSGVFRQVRRFIIGIYVSNYCTFAPSNEFPKEAARTGAACQFPTTRFFPVGDFHHSSHDVGKDSSVHNMFDGMQERSPLPVDNLFNRFLCALKKSTLTADKKPISIAHCLGLKIGALAHLPVSTTVLVAYSRATDPRASLALFKEIPEKDLVLHNAMTSALVENCCFHEALEFFVDMVKKNCRFDSTSLLIVLSSSTRTGQLVTGKLIHGLALRSGMASDISLGNALINMYAKCGDLSSSECFFLGMEYRDSVTWNAIITGCLYNNEPESCLEYFRERGFHDKKWDSVSLSAAIRAASCLADASLGQILHVLVIKIGLEDSFCTSVANSLISLYSDCGDSEAAEIVFGGVMMGTDVVSWNAMINGYALNGRIFEAFGLVHQMLLLESLKPDKITVLTLVSVCADKMLLSEGKVLHGLVARNWLESDLSLTNGLIDMYLRCKCVDKANILFESIPERDLVSWNTMISGYSLNGLFEEAQMLFKRMLMCNSECSLATLLAILPSCNSPEYLPLGKSIHCLQLKFGFSHGFARNSVMYMYIGCGNVAAAFSLLLRHSTHRDVTCWNTFIAGCTKNCFFWEALKAFNLMMRQLDVIPDSITLGNAILAAGNLELYFVGKIIHGLAVRTLSAPDIRVLNALVTMYGRCGDIASARSVFSSDPSVNLCSWNCMISALCQNEFHAEAIELLRHLDFLPDEITLTSIISACSELGLGRHGMEIHTRAFRLGFYENSFLCAALVDMYSNCGKLDLATCVFRTLPLKSVAAWNSMIAAYGFHGHGNKAIKIFKNMLKSGMKATSSTFVSVLTACSHSGLVKEGMWYYDNMVTKFGVERVSDHHVCMVDMLGRSGKLFEAYGLIKRIDCPDPGVWGALLSSCKYHGELDLAREVAEVLFRLDPNNPGYYISLSNMYVADGGWKDAVELRKIIQAKRLRKPIAYSLVEVGLA